jgi:nitronate monooxygenase
VARSDLVVAVSRAGGFGFLGMVREPAELIRREVAALRAAGIDNFGINIIPASTSPALLAEQVETIIDLAVPAVALFWDVDAEVVRRFRAAGIRVVHQVGSVDEALAAERAGAQVIVAQGREAGGHVKGDIPLRQLLPAIVNAVDAPVLAAGGLACGADLVVAQALGAAGIVLGTAFIATTESFAHPHHQQRLIGAGAGDTLLIDIFHINWPKGAKVRVLQNAVTRGERGDPWTDAREVIGEEEGRPIYLFSTDSPLRSMSGEFELMALYAGTGVGSVKRVKSAKEVIDDIMNEWTALLALPTGLELPLRASAVCYADEISPDYMGQLFGTEAEAEIATLVDLLRQGLTQALETPASGERPPFDRAGLLFARYLLALRPYAGDAPARQPSARISPALLPALLLQRLRGVIPRLPEDRPRKIMSVLARDLDAGLVFPL